MNLFTLISDLDELLEIEAVSDYCPNGLQVEGRHEIRKIVTGVSASQALFRNAIELDADLILVHHGILWNGTEPPRIAGSFRERIKLLLDHGVSLAAYHLPLDRHMALGNAAQLARRLGLEQLEPFGEHRGVSIGVCGVLPEPVPAAELAEAVAAACHREPQLFEGGPRAVSSVGIVTGAAQREYHQAVAAGLDAYITGEASEWVQEQAAEDGVHYIAAGHYATERFGVVALGRWLEEERDLDVEFLDLVNPV
ncbi:MAG: Nif3-like dinuclear metal center hexameric protein [Acidobacteria bacterium]|nr:Nif3-like dinuclear metal center hexameric protein [Acidobacteriota bacterium]